MGYTKETIATATKVFGIWMTILGGFLGGWLVIKFGVMRVLMLGAILAAGHQPACSWPWPRRPDRSACSTG